MFIAMADHGGTHIDAPGACSPRGISINPYPLKKCIVPRICIELRTSRAEIMPLDLDDAVRKTGGVPKAHRNLDA